MKVSQIECLTVHAGWRKNFVFVRIETDAGIVGWGEAYSQYDRDRAIAAQVEELGRYVVGRDPFQIRHILQMAFDDYAQRRGSLEFYCATSGIEQALWDIAGKTTQQPVYNLLGGPVRSRIRVYANGWSYKMQKPEDYARGAAAVLERGFTAMKFDPVPGPWRTYHSEGAYPPRRQGDARHAGCRGSGCRSVARYPPALGARCTRSSCLRPWRSSSPTGWKSPASAKTSRRSPRCGGQVHSGGDRGGALYPRGFPPDFPSARGRYHQPRCFELRRHSGTHVYRGRGGIEIDRGVPA